MSLAHPSSEWKQLPVSSRCTLPHESTATIHHQKAASVVVVGMEKVPFERVLGEEIGAIMQEFHELKCIFVSLFSINFLIRFQGRSVPNECHHE